MIEPLNKIIQDTFYSNLDKAWSHFEHKPYALNESEIADLSGFIQKKIKEDHFESVFKKLERFLKERKND